MNDLDRFLSESGAFFDFYILDENDQPRAEPNPLSYYRWRRENEKRRRVGLTDLGPASVSTVFLGMNHNFSHYGSPILWETMVFGGRLDEAQVRCSGGREQAEAMHAEMVAQVAIAEGIPVAT